MFKYSIQLAGYPFDKCDEKGEVSLQEFLQVIESFPWVEQMVARNSIAQGCSATVSVLNTVEQTALWLSVAGTAFDYKFLLGVVYFKTKSNFWGLGKQKVVKWLDIYLIDTLATAQNYFRLFFEHDITQLKNNIAKEIRVDSMESKI
jgi:hypothetical protein